MRQRVSRSIWYQGADTLALTLFQRRGGAWVHLQVEKSEEGVRDLAKVAKWHP